MWSEFGIHWYEWIWWPGSYGLVNSDWTLRDPVGVVWAKHLGRPHRLNVSTLPINILATIDGVPFKTTPFSAWLGEGEHVVSVPKEVV
jgi:hypothetical protein